METVTLWTPRSDNVQTGDMPQAWCGRSFEEARDGCARSGCPYYYGRSPVAVSCYAWNGTAACAYSTVVRMYRKDPARYTLQHAIEHASRGARFVRVSALGDPSIIGPEEAGAIVRTVKAAGLQVLGYVAGWRLAPWWGGILRASVFTDEDETAARDAGWRVARVAPAHTSTPTYAGRGLVCPTKRGLSVQCNGCGSCQGGKGPAVVWFPDHSSSVRAKEAAARRKARLAAIVAA